MKGFAASTHFELSHVNALQTRRIIMATSDNFVLFMKLGAVLAQLPLGLARLSLKPTQLPLRLSQLNK